MSGKNKKNKKTQNESQLNKTRKISKQAKANYQLGLSLNLTDFNTQAEEIISKISLSPKYSYEAVLRWGYPKVKDHLDILRTSVINSKKLISKALINWDDKYIDENSGFKNLGLTIEHILANDDKKVKNAYLNSNKFFINDYNVDIFETYKDNIDFILSLGKSNMVQNNFEFRFKPFENEIVDLVQSKVSYLTKASKEWNEDSKKSINSILGTKFITFEDRISKINENNILRKVDILTNDLTLDEFLNIPESIFQNSNKISSCYTFAANLNLLDEFRESIKINIKNETISEYIEPIYEIVKLDENNILRKLNISNYVKSLDDISDIPKSIFQYSNQISCCYKFAANYNVIEDFQNNFKINFERDTVDNYLAPIYEIAKLDEDNILKKLNILSHVESLDEILDIPKSIFQYSDKISRCYKFAAKHKMINNFQNGFKINLQRDTISEYLDFIDKYFRNSAIGGSIYKQVATDSNFNLVAKIMNHNKGDLYE